MQKEIRPRSVHILNKIESDDKVHDKVASRTQDLPWGWSLNGSLSVQKYKSQYKKYK